MFSVVNPIVTIVAAMARGSILVSFLLVFFTRAASLLAVIILISFKDTDLLYYLLPDVMAPVYGAP